MRRRRIDEPDVPAQINVVPLIDVLFAILTFFIMSTLFLGRVEGLAVNLPGAKSAQPQQVVRATVTLDRAGKLYFNKNQVPIEALQNAIQAANQPGQDLVIVLNADGSVTHDQVIAVMDQIRQVKGVKLAIATQRR